MDVRHAAGVGARPSRTSPPAGRRSLVARIRAGGGWHPALPPLAVGVAGALVCTAAYLLDLPYRPLCPFYVLTGYWCPGCGSSRALHAITHGDLAEAMARNPVSTLALPVLVGWWAWWLYRSATGRPRTWLAPPAAIWGLFVAVAVFWVLRNLPGMQWLAP